MGGWVKRGLIPIGLGKSTHLSDPDICTPDASGRRIYGTRKGITTVVSGSTGFDKLNL